MIRMVLAEEFRLLTFRRASVDIRLHRRAFLAFGFLCTWLAGIGRYWDNPRALPWQVLGLGSIAYVVVLALVIWGVAAPLRPRNWDYWNVLLFVTLTAPPAILYAIPVERFLPAADARAANAWLLAIVAAWRLALLGRFLRTVAGFSVGIACITLLLPVAMTIVALAMLNLEHVVFNIMGGIREEARSPHDGAYGVVILLASISTLASPLLLVAYVLAIHRIRRRA